MEAAAKLAEQGIEAEVLDLRTLVPLDWDAIVKTVAKTHNAIIVSEEVKRGSFAGELSAQIGEELFDELDAPVERVCGLNKSGNTVSFEAEKVLVAIGRKANTAALDLAAGKIDNDKGRILVNDKMENNVPGVYAIGDCVFGHTQLAHTASAMGEVASENICGHEAHYCEKTNPTCVYMEPEAASVGLTEEQCKAQGIAYKVGKFPMSANGKALILNGGEGLVKIIAGAEYGEILGMHIIGPRATALIAEGALAIEGEMTPDEIIDTILHHGTLLFDANPDMVAGALQVEPEKFRSKSTKSVRSRIGNIRSFLKQDMDMPAFWAYLKDTLAGSGMVFDALTPQELGEVEKRKAEKYDTWEWNYGRSPKFDMTGKRYWDGGCLEVGVSVAHGVITDVRFHGDFLAVCSMEPLVEALRGVPFRREDVRRVLDSQPMSELFGGITEEQVLGTMFGS